MAAKDHTSALLGKFNCWAFVELSLINLGFFSFKAIEKLLLTYCFSLVSSMPSLILKTTGLNVINGLKVVTVSSAIAMERAC